LTLMFVLGGFASTGPIRRPLAQAADRPMVDGVSRVSRDSRIGRRFEFWARLRFIGVSPDAVYRRTRRGLAMLRLSQGTGRQGLAALLLADYA
jgi:hypothetical protein